MAADWLGSLVSINCGVTLGVYQGEVSAVDQASQTISLKQPFHNGIKCPVPEVTFSAMDIKELKILEIPGSGQGGHPDFSSVGHNGRSAKGPVVPSSAPMAVPRKGELRVQEGFNSPQQFSKSYGERHLEVTSQAKGFRRRHNSWSSSSRGPSQATPKKNGLKNGQMKTKDDECFGDGMEESLDTDFDFEGNLALFDKAAVFSQIEISERRNGARSRGTPNERTPSRYRHDENILEAEPIIYRQITVPQHGGKEYCTDSGLVVPSVPFEMHKRLISVAERYGLSLERRLEMAGVCASQMALTLLGGPNRLTPKNVHQRPTVALLCGPHVQGAQGISCGRHLANHEVHIILFLPNFVKMLESITNELTLFGKTDGKQVSSVKDLPDSPVDLVINCLDCHENAFLRDQQWYRAAVDWANQNRAPVLSIDPPVSSRELAVEAKWSLCLGLPLPLAEGAGRLYLCDIGIPRQVFQEVGINYHSPFGCKFVIPLHST
ncbi:enhancer of mRNA-decapping protein 3 isoform X1 [Amia ocellicauda]|uniref:enhancer of mRNA-decapping protein 3 isoform X1 n=1 Tax=Amia ocellicauda TaxID=2972642 RepID=UPI003464E623